MIPQRRRRDSLAFGAVALGAVLLVERSALGRITLDDVAGQVDHFHGLHLGQPVGEEHDVGVRQGAAHFLGVAIHGRIHTAPPDGGEDEVGQTGAQQRLRAQRWRVVGAVAAAIVAVAERAVALVHGLGARHVGVAEGAGFPGRLGWSA